MIHSHFSKEEKLSAFIRMTVALFYIQGLVAIKVIQSVPLVSRINIQELAS